MRLFRALILSLAIHFLMGISLNFVRPVVPPLPPNAIDNFVEFMEETKARSDEERPIVRSQQLPADYLRERTPQDKARFQSENDQTVIEERRAAESGMTANRSLFSSAQQFPRNGGSRGAAPRTGPRDKPDLSLMDRLPPSPGDVALDDSETAVDSVGDDPNGRPLKFPDVSALSLERGRSTMGENLPNDIRIGDFTALNTDRHLYYSFYARAEELIRHHWEKYVKAVLYTYQRSGAATGDEYWITRVEILLDNEGRFVKGIVHQGAGVQGLDLAPIHAFREAGQIPHPPAEMVKEDGLIHMNYEFSVRMIGRMAGL